MKEKKWELEIGATVTGKGKAGFTVWAPKAKSVSVRVLSKGSEERIPLKEGKMGYFKEIADGINAGDRYLYLLDDIPYPDPASRYQPEGVHGPSQVIDHGEFQWDDRDWKGIPLKDFIIYELHVGTFTKEGTFEAVIQRLDYLKELGISAVELMPVAQFPGARNWGYDGVYPFAPQNSYGGPHGLKRLVNACHGKGLSVVLDVVYNHLGPEGNYLSNFAPYFTDRYKTPWGDAINFDGPYSDEVRRFFIDNALYWITEYHFDALRIDAIHGIFDFSSRHFLEELGETVHRQAEALGRKVYVVAESDLNDVRVINPCGIGGYGLDAQWNDDFHHALHTMLTGEDKGYYADFGVIRQMEKAFREGFVYSGEYSKFRKRRHGSSTKKNPACQLIVFSQNHDQVGNRAMGDRLSQTQSLERLKLAAAAVILSPYIPLLFMGEEYSEIAPFQYFVSHSDKGLIEAVRRGRLDDFALFAWEGEIPDPQAESTFLRSKVNLELRNHGNRRALFDFYRELIRLRRESPALSNLSKEHMELTAFEEEKVLCIRRRSVEDDVLLIYNFNEKGVTVNPVFPSYPWQKRVDSSSERWGGIGSTAVDVIESSTAGVNLNPHNVILYHKKGGL